MDVNFQYPRRLVFQVGNTSNPETFNGWSCERCCWHIRLTDIDLARKVEQLFAEHDCQRFAQENWNEA
jgi:hypothetical protein